MPSHSGSSTSARVRCELQALRVAHSRREIVVKALRSLQAISLQPSGREQVIAQGGWNLIMAVIEKHSHRTSVLEAAFNVLQNMSLAGCHHSALSSHTRALRGNVFLVNFLHHQPATRRAETACACWGGHFPQSPKLCLLRFLCTWALSILATSPVTSRSLVFSGIFPSLVRLWVHSAPCLLSSSLFHRQFCLSGVFRQSDRMTCLSLSLSPRCLQGGNLSTGCEWPCHRQHQQAHGCQSVGGACFCSVVELVQGWYAVSPPCLFYPFWIWVATD